MIQSVIYARDRWANPGCVMYPSSSRLLLASLHDKPFVAARETEADDAMRSWDDSAADMLARYKIDFSALRPQYEREHHAYAYRQAWQGRVPKASVATDEVLLLELDMHTAAPATVVHPLLTVVHPLLTGAPARARHAHGDVVRPLRLEPRRRPRAAAGRAGAYTPPHHSGVTPP